MASLPQILASIWGRKKALGLVMEYRAAFAGRALLLADLAKVCEVGTTAPSTAIGCVKQAAKQEVFAHIARVLELKPEHFVEIVDGRNDE